MVVFSFRLTVKVILNFRCIRNKSRHFPLYNKHIIERTKNKLTAKVLNKIYSNKVLKWRYLIRQDNTIYKFR